MKRLLTIAMLLGGLCAVRTHAAQLELQVTVYYVALEHDYSRGTDASFRSADGRILYRSSKEFLRAASMEGTARLKDGTVVNLMTKRGEPRWAITSARYGLSSEGCALVPFYSAAVDPRIIPLGSRVFIPAMVGMKLSDGRVHDGVWKAVDTGPSIVGNRIDLFTGNGVANAMTFKRSLADRVGRSDPLMLKVEWKHHPAPSPSPCD